MSGTFKYLQEHYNMESTITLEQYLRTYYNGRELNNVDIYGVDSETYETFLGCLSYEDLQDNDLKDLRDLKVIFINDSNIIVYIEDKEKFIEYYL
jgi:D-hexose-6-phosphate mutarotase